MLLARIIEGVSFSFIMVTGMVLITNWFKDSGYGLAVGIFGTFSALGYAAVIYLLPMLFEQFGLKSIWLTLGIAAAIIGLFFLFFFENTAKGRGRQQACRRFLPGGLEQSGYYDAGHRDVDRKLYSIYVLRWLSHHV